MVIQLEAGLCNHPSPAPQVLLVD